MCQDAIESRDKIVWVDAHIQEPAKNVDDVVGVNRREDEMACERRLNGNLGRLHIANFSDHDLVRVMTENRAEAAGERQTLLFIDGYLCDAPDLIFHGIFDRENLVFLVFDLQQGGV